MDLFIVYIYVSNLAKKAGSRGCLRLMPEHPYLNLCRAPVGGALPTIYMYFALRVQNLE